MVVSTFLKFRILNCGAEIRVSRVRSRQRAHLCRELGGYMRGAKGRKEHRAAAAAESVFRMAPPS